MKQEVKEKFLAIAEQSVKEVKASNLSVNEKNTVEQYAKLIEERIDILEKGDIRRDKYIADLEEYSAMILKVLHRIPNPIKKDAVVTPDPVKLSGEPTQESNQG